MIERAEAVILRHPEYSVAEIARACAVSESALYEAFRKHPDKSIAQIRRGGIMEAPDIAHYDSVSEIALGQMFGEAAAAFFD